MFIINIFSFIYLINYKKLISQIFIDEQVNIKQFSEVCTSICNLPQFLAPMLFERINKGSNKPDTISKIQFLKQK